MDLNSRSRRHLEWLIQNQPELVRDLHNSNKLEDRLDERYQRALELTDQIKKDKGVSDEEAFEIASDLVLTPAEKDPLAKKTHLLPTGWALPPIIGRVVHQSHPHATRERISSIIPPTVSQPIYHVR